MTGGDRVCLDVDGTPVSVAPGTSVAAAVELAGVTAYRRSVRDMPRGPVCGMGICFECRVRVNGRSGVRSCRIECEEGMQVLTGRA